MRTQKLNRLNMILMLSAIVVLAVGPAGASVVEPVEYPGNPTCQDLGYQYGFKPFDGGAPPTGETTLTFPDGINTIILDSDGTYVDWVSTIGLDIFIVKGGDSANLYYYDPEATADTGLHSPQNSSGDWAAISHVEFCYDYEVDVAKTAETSYTQDITWDIAKGVGPDAWTFFSGDSGTSNYIVTVTRTDVFSEWLVWGTITIDNNTPLPAVIESVVDNLSISGAVTVDCGVTFPLAMEPGTTLECTYSQPLTGTLDQVNTATVTTSGDVGGGEGSANVVFGDPSVVTGPETIQVDDTNGSSWTFTDSGYQTYSQTFDCTGVTYDAASHGSYSHLNTATIVETQASDQATVDVDCYQLDVDKTAVTAVDRTYEWQVQKSVADAGGLALTHLDLAPGQVYQAFYSIDVDIIGHSDDAWSVTGTINVTNPAPISAWVLGVTDQLPGSTGMTVDCGEATFPFDLGAGQTLPCTYSADLPDASLAVNTAYASLQNYILDSSGGATPSGTSSFSGSAAVDFGDPGINNEYDTCIDVNDSFFEDPVGTVCFGIDSLPANFPYEWSIGPFSEPDDCGQLLINNTATIVTDGTGTTDQDQVTVEVDVHCSSGGGCTLTPGYWKTHSIYGPAPYDDTWLQLGEDSPFFYAYDDAGIILSYYDVLWTPPSGGNAYFILAHAYIAAVLNDLNDADVPAEIGFALDWAQAWFDDPEHTPEYAFGLKKGQGRAERADMLMRAALLDQYNNGDIGPGHCSE